MPATQKCVKMNRVESFAVAPRPGSISRSTHTLLVDLRTLADRFRRLAEEDLKTLLDLVAGGRAVLVIDKVLPLEETAEGERLLEDREVVGKVLLKP